MAKPTILEVFDRKTGLYVKPEALLGTPEHPVSRRSLHNLRSAIEGDIEDLGSRDYQWGCGLCGKPVKSVKESIDHRRAHFRHLFESDANACPWSTGETLDEETVRKRKYRGATESEEHQRLKHRIADLLRRQYGDDRVTVEGRIVGNDEGWRQPDVFLRMPDGRGVAIELQLSTTFLSVIVERTRFYQRNGLYLLWVLRAPNDKNWGLRTAEWDIYYLNRETAYFLTDGADRRSEAEDRLFLEAMSEIWEEDRMIRRETAMVTLDDLAFLPDGFRIMWPQRRTYRSAAEIWQSDDQVFQNVGSTLNIVGRDGLTDGAKARIANALPVPSRRPEDRPTVTNQEFRVLGYLYSMKLGRVVGAKHPTLSAFAHTVFGPQYRRYWPLLREACRWQREALYRPNAEGKVTVPDLVAACMALCRGDPPPTGKALIFLRSLHGLFPELIGKNGDIIPQTRQGEKP